MDEWREALEQERLADERMINYRRGLQMREAGADGVFDAPLFPPRNVPLYQHANPNRFFLATTSTQGPTSIATTHLRPLDWIDSSNGEESKLPEDDSENSNLRPSFTTRMSFTSANGTHSNGDVRLGTSSVRATRMSEEDDSPYPLREYFEAGIRRSLQQSSNRPTVTSVTYGPRYPVGAGLSGVHGNISGAADRTPLTIGGLPVSTYTTLSRNQMATEDSGRIGSRRSSLDYVNEWEDHDDVDD